VQDRLKGRGARYVIIILDACRNNPWKSDRGLGGELAGMSGRGVYVAFAAAPGDTADDNRKERNGRFTKHLLTAIVQPGLSIDDVFNQVRENVAAETGDRQVPFSNSGLIGRFVFNSGLAGPSPIAPAPLPVAQAPPPGSVARGTKTNPVDGLTYVWIKSGTFMMGASPGDTQLFDDEPAHPVTITRGFWMGQTPVTQEAYQRVTGTNPSNFKGSKLPVETVTWSEAQGYCQTLGMRLPTEAEWEYAAKAGSRASRYGDIDRIAWYAANSGGKPHEVGQKQPNAWGLFDMLGNVWQWTSSDYNDGRKEIRGGAWDLGRLFARASTRGRAGPGEYRSKGTGFRCVGD
jgi:formylglycine-generating enzyme required for sulfatase activity